VQEISEMAEIHRTAVVGENVQLGEDAVIGPHCVVGNEVSIGARTVLQAHVYIGDRVTIGADNLLSPNCALGCLPQVLGLNLDTRLGMLRIGDRNVIRENVTIHPSKYEDAATTIGNDNLLMIGTHLGHDCVVEDKVVLSNLVQIGGHSKIETGVWMSGLAGAHQFVTVGRWAYAAGMAGLNRDVPPFMMVSGHYPFEVRGVNMRGLTRAGFSEQQQERICQAYRKLYRTGSPLLANAGELAKEDGLDENVKALLDAIFKSNEHRFGRYRETFRK
jgi:UDP-N-acetylglucosamine acyltransferase